VDLNTVAAIGAEPGRFRFGSNPVGLPLNGRFTAGQAARARLLKILHNKGMKLSQLARVANLALDDQAFIVYDGHDLRVCRDAAAAIATVVKAKQPCRLSISPRSALLLRNNPTQKAI